MHPDAYFRKFGACDLDCLESFCPCFTQCMAMGEFAFTQAPARTQHPHLGGFYWADLPLFRLAKKTCGTAVAALCMCRHFCYFIMPGWLYRWGA